MQSIFDSVLLYGGLTLTAVSAMALTVYLLLWKGKKRLLEHIFDEEYGSQTGKRNSDRERRTL